MFNESPMLRDSDMPVLIESGTIGDELPLLCVVDDARNDRSATSPPSVVHQQPCTVERHGWRKRDARMLHEDRGAR